MAKRRASPDIIEEFESTAERMAHWIGENRVLVAGVIGGVLVASLAWGGFASWARDREEAASNALDQARSAYFEALGASPGAIVEPELANPKAAQAIQERFVTRFEAVADEHAGTVAGTFAIFELARLMDKLGRSDETDPLWERAVDAAEGHGGLRGLVHQRRAVQLEERGEWAAAAAEHAAAGDDVDYALRHWALVDAARCAVAGGDAARALALYQRVEQEAPDLELPGHLAIQYRELQATLGG